MILYLIRHATTDATGTVLLGRTPGIDLNAEGREQALQLAHHWQANEIRAIVSSPLERARQTAGPLVKKLGVGMQVADALTDIEFGDWAGRLISELEPLEKWKQWNLFRSSVRIPKGELMSEVQSRMLAEVDRWLRACPTQSVVLVSHADPIRSVLAHFLGMPLDLLHRIEISPASVSVVNLGLWGAQVLQVNLQVPGRSQAPF